MEAISQNQFSQVMQALGTIIELLRKAGNAHDGATAAVVDLSKLPIVLTLEEMSAIYRRGKGTIRRELQQGSFKPTPFGKLPYRWLRTDVERDLQRRSVEAHNRKFGPKRRPRP